MFICIYGSKEDVHIFELVCLVLFSAEETKFDTFESDQICAVRKTLDKNIFDLVLTWAVYHKSRLVGSLACFSSKESDVGRSFRLRIYNKRQISLGNLEALASLVTNNHKLIISKMSPVYYSF